MRYAGFWKLILAVGLGMLLSSCDNSNVSSDKYVEAKPGTTLNFTGPSIPVALESVTSEESFLLERALSMVGGMPIGEGNRNLLNVREFSGEGLNEWLSQRMKVVLGVNTRFSSILIEPEDGRGAGAVLDGPEFRAQLRSAYMGNMSAHFVGVQDKLFAKHGKKIIHKLRLKNQTIAMDDITGGVFLAGNALTKDHMKNVVKAIGYKPENYFNLALTISILIHESRHGEGRGIHKGLKHRKCVHLELDKEDEDVPFCDDTLNGPNGSAVAFLKYAKKLCTDCNDHEVGAFDAVILEFSSRVIPGSPLRDLTPAKEDSAAAI